MHWYTVRNVPLEDMLSQELEYWFEEYTYTKFHDLIEVPEEYSENHVGRFSLMIYENANRIGCSAGISQFTFGIFTRYHYLENLSISGQENTVLDILTEFDNLPMQFISGKECERSDAKTPFGWIVCGCFKHISHT
uniref:Uncharacterized protein n=1 Tax=Megaselia scalaris TaxID=36166 RepID=T1GCJ3_MEGSC